MTGWLRGDSSKYLDVNRVLWQIPGNGHDVPRSKVAPRLASRVPRNRSEAPRNTRIVPESIFAPRKDPTVPRNAETVTGNIHPPPGPVPFCYVLGSWPNPTLKARLAQPGLT
jgi:hypothetical protein